MEITKREVILSIAIVAIMLIVGFFISDNIAARQDEKNAEYQKAIQIDDAELFKYGMNTNVGNAFVYGKLSAVDTVTYKEIGGEYLYIKKVEEHYNRHVRTYTDSDGYTRTKVYYTWDYHDSWSKHSKRIKFCNVEFDYNKINIPSDSYLDTIKESPRVRYKYYVVDKEHEGTIYTALKDQTISDNSMFYTNITIERALEISTSGAGVVIFWMFWIMLTIAAVGGFYYIDNKWLE
jgi:hypothetical protein